MGYKTICNEDAVLADEAKPFCAQYANLTIYLICIYLIDIVAVGCYNTANPIESGRETDLMTPQQPKTF